MCVCVCACVCVCVCVRERERERCLVCNMVTDATDPIPVACQLHISSPVASVCLNSCLWSTQVSVVPLSNNALMSPYDLCDPRFQSTSASLQFHWRGMDDPTVTQVHYRFIHESQVRGLFTCDCLSVCQSVSDTSPLPIHSRVTGEGFVYLSVCLSVTQVHYRFMHKSQVRDLFTCLSVCQTPQ